ncbi:MAG: TolC family outer membrane protein [Gammaproteobacteria bacterium]|nr:TolC family outer membrane protein [Gammaproteobacteria bacterium]
MKKLIPLLLLLPLGVGQAADLIQLYEQALDSDPVLRGARSTRESAQELRPQALAPLLPQVDLAASVDRINMDDRDNGTVKGADLRLRQPILRFDQWIRLDQSKDVIEQAGAQYSQEEINLIVRVAQTYFGILAAEDNLSFSQAEMRAISRQLDQAKQRFDVGLIAITDVHEVQAAYDQARANVIVATNDLDSAWEALREIVANLEERKLLGLRSKIPMSKPNPANIEEWINLAMERSPQVLAANSGLSASRKQIELERSGHLPSLDLVAGSSINSSTSPFIGNDNDTNSIGLQLSLPLYAGGSVSSRTRQARHDFVTASEGLEQARRAVRRDVSDYYRGVLSSISKVAALESAIRSAQSALEATQAGFDVGTRTMVDVLTVQRNLFKARADYSNARYQYILNGLGLKATAGIISIDDLRLVNGLLQGRS